MRVKYLVFTFLLALMGCSEEQIPAGIYHYQVERLLSGQDGSKAWMQMVNSANCADSVQLRFELVTGSDDSLDISIVTGCSSSSVTNSVGRASASKAADRDLFTDSLIFSTGEFWLVSQITSQQLYISIDGQSAQYLAE